MTEESAVDSWYLRLVWDTYESDLLKVVGIPDDWDGDATQALIAGVQDEPVLIAINGEFQDRDDSYFAVTVRMEGDRVGFGFMARTAEVLPPSEQDAENRALSLLEEFMDQHGHAKVPSDYVVDDFALGRWVQNVRRSRGLPQRLVDALNRLPKWKWE